MIAQTFKPGALVMSRDPGRKMATSIAPHGPWIYHDITKYGLALIRHPRTGERRRVPPSLLANYEPTSLSEYFDHVYWGWQRDVHGAVAYRKPLPPTEHSPLVGRQIGEIHGRTHHAFPPYLVAGLARGGIDVMLCAGDGWRASTSGDPAELKDNDPRWIYIGGANVPFEWEDAITEALHEIGSSTLWRVREMSFRPEPDRHSGRHR